MKSNFATIDTAIAEIKAGNLIILVDDEKRENEGDLVIAAEKTTPDIINFMSKHGRGLICMPMAASEIDRLELPAMVTDNTSKFNTAFTQSIGAKKGITTGISAADRATTVLTAINSKSKNHDLSMPGHIFPLRGTDGGVLKRKGHTEGSLDLVKLAGLKPGAVICEIMDENGTMARLPALKELAKKHKLPIVSIADLILYRTLHEIQTKELTSTEIHLKEFGKFTIKIYEDQIDKLQHVALIHGNIKNLSSPLIRMHSQCFTGDIFGSSHCDCGWQLQAALKKISESDGVLLYLNQEGRGIGLVNKIKAYALQEKGMDTVEANEKLGFSADARDYRVAAQILKDLKLNNIKLLTNNPHKIESLEKYGINVKSRETLETIPTKDNINYLRTKRDKLGHILSLDGV